MRTRSARAVGLVLLLGALSTACSSSSVPIADCGATHGRGLTLSLPGHNTLDTGLYIASSPGHRAALCVVDGTPTRIPIDAQIIGAAEVVEFSFAINAPTTPIVVAVTGSGTARLDLVGVPKPALTAIQSGYRMNAFWVDQHTAEQIPPGVYAHKGMTVHALAANGQILGSRIVD